LNYFWRGDPVLHDNFLFKLHHQANFAIIFFGVAFIFGMNYLDGTAIQCTANKHQHFSEKYCWLHGSGHIVESLRPDGDGGLQCIANQNEVSGKEDERHTRYYLWVPFVLVLCLALIKAPRVLWKEVCERGTIAGAVRGGDLDTQPADKIAERFNKLRSKADRFHWGFLLCELLNIVSVFLSFTILDALFGEKFFKFGAEFLAPSAEVDPLCNLFPTVVSCNVRTMGATGNPDNANILCLLSNNLFNQYYFLIIWFWWVFLLALSTLGLVYRLAQICLPAVSRWVFLRKLEPHGLHLWRPKMTEDLSSGDFFLLGRICQNLKGSQIGKVLQELDKPGSSLEVKTEGESVNHTRVTMTTNA